MRPIPKNILIHSATYKSVVQDEWGAETDTNFDLEKVYIEPSNEIVKTTENTEIKSSSMLFYDIKNSSYKSAGISQTPNFIQDDKIIFNGVEYRILKVDEVYQQNTTQIHHYEIYLR